MKNLKTFLLISIVVFLSNQKIHAQAGTLDPTFGEGGVVIYDTFNTSNASLIQPDGKIVLFSDGLDAMSISRFNTDGSFDLSFGINGRAYYNYNNSKLGRPYEMALQEDGKLVMVCNYFPKGYTGGIFDVGIIRCNTNGTPDSSFGVNGLDTVEFDKFNTAHGLVIQQDGKIVVSGDISKSDYTEKKTFLFRLMTNGGLDPEFGDSGIVISNYSQATHNAGLILRPNGKLVKGSVFNYYDDHSTFQLESFNPDGSVDESFGINGVAKYIFGEGQGGIWNTEMNTMGIKDDGKIVCAGTSGKGQDISMALCCFKADGSVDESFGDNGGVLLQVAGSDYSEIHDITFQSDGKIIASGTYFEISSPVPYLLARFNANGQLDPEFGDNGITITRLDSSYTSGSYAHVLPDGKILVTGSISLQGYILLMRFNGDNVLAANFKDVKAVQNKDAITITWQTLNESDTKSFTVERSGNANDYVGINTVPAKGVASNYSYTDKNPLDGISYYRIKENAANGTNTFSPVVKVVFNSTGIISLYPNPAKNMVTVKGLNKNSTAVIKITDMQGREISSQNFTQNSSATLNIRALAQGTYFVQVAQDNKIVRLKLIKE